MLIAGDVGGTKTRLALISPDEGPRKLLAEQDYASQDFPGLTPIVESFMATHAEGAAVTSACFDVAGPVIDGHAHLTNLPWTLDETGLARDLKLRRVSLLNDLKAIAHAVPHLLPEEGAPSSTRRSAFWRRAQASARPSSSGPAKATWPANPKADIPTSPPPIRCRPGSGPS
jgi:glucokinase